MPDPLTQDPMTLADDPDIRAMLGEICRLSGMGFAAVARVTEERWIACQVLDRIEFGLDAGDELAIKTTICDDIRQTCRLVVIDDAATEPEWRTHPTPILYGFKSYASLPIVLSDGRFFGTLCAIDPNARDLRGSEVVALMARYANRIAAIVEGQAVAGDPAIA